MNNAVIQQFKSIVCLNTITNKHSFTPHSFLKITLSEFYTVMFEHFVKKKKVKKPIRLHQKKARTLNIQTLRCLNFPAHFMLYNTDKNILQI